MSKETQPQKPRITRQLIERLLREAIAKIKADLADHELISAALKPLDGHAMTTKRIEKLLPQGWKVIYQYGSTQAVSPRDRLHLMGFYSDTTFKWDQFPARNSWACVGTKERIQQLEGILNEPGMIETVRAVFGGIQKAITDLKRYQGMIERFNLDSFNNPIYYELLRAAGSGSKLMQDIIKYNHEINNSEEK